MTEEVDTVRSIVYQYMLSRGEQTDINYERYEMHALNFARKLRLNNAYGLENHIAPALAVNNGIIQMESDYVKYFLVGYVDHASQRIITLAYDKDLFPGGPPLCESPTPGYTNNPEDTIYVGLSSYFGSQSGMNYANGGGWADTYFTEDRKGKRIIVNPPMYNKEIFVRYVSYGRGMNGSTVLPYEFVEPAKDWIRWQEALAIGARDEEKYRRIYDLSMKEADLATSPLVMRRLIDMYNAASHIGIKRA